MSSSICQKCEQAPWEFENPALLCESCWIGWWTAGPNTQNEWNAFFKSIGKKGMIRVPDSQRVIVFEGPDCCGKTNMARELEHRLGIPYFKNKGEWANFERDGDYFVNIMKYGDLGLLSQFLYQTKTSAILDRSWASEWVYSKVFGRKTDDEVMQSLDAIYRDMSARIIVPLRSDYSKAVDQFELIDENKLVELHAVYLEFVEWTSCRTLVLNVDDEDLEREMAEVIPFVRSA